MKLYEELAERLRRLRLSGILATLDTRIEQAAKGQLDYMEFLELIVQDELERREAKRLAERFKRAHFEGEKTLAEFDFGFNPRLNRTQIKELSTCRFVEKKENVLLCGPVGVGKTHIAQSIGHQACRQGYDVLFVKANKLFSSLYAARADNSWSRVMKSYLKSQLLIVDDFGLKPLSNNQTDDFHDIVSERYERGSIVVTSNRPFDEWLSLFSDPIIGNSSLDRLSHHSHQMMIEGDSYRQKDRRNRKEVEAEKSEKE